MKAPARATARGHASRSQQAATAGYLLVARHLPWSPRPGGRSARRIRAALAGWMLDSCGSEVNIEHGAWFGSGKGISVGDRSAIGVDALVIGPVSIGADVMMGPRCVLLSISHAYQSTDVPMTRQGFLPDRPIVIEDDVWIGAGVTILPGVRVGHGSIVGAAAVLTREVPPWSVVGGNPARVLRRRRPDDSSQNATDGPESGN